MAVSTITRNPPRVNETVLYNEDNWNISYIKSGDTVTVYILRAATTTVDATLAYLPGNCRPAHDFGVRSYYADGFCEIKTNGGIRVKANSEWIEFCATYNV